TDCDDGAECTQDLCDTATNGCLHDEIAGCRETDAGMPDGGLGDAGVDAAAPSFNHALLNYYADGLASMGAHSDDEAELGPEPCIASLSFGATRRFLVRPKRAATRQRSLGFDLAHGELFVMGGAMQHEYKHALPKTKEAVGPRLNITLRGVRAPIASSSAARGHRRA
ncbi:MAG TPA: alpha-ketoglutarate-dependent dioxygenase AlkB, partial [Planctomycetota bacterium]|nr:alpha-ketoglutarate-dependent dioxygenase AlkB [Planctomycetota bacterium]